jgi:hypothetical protein
MLANWKQLFPQMFRLHGGDAPNLSGLQPAIQAELDELLDLAAELGAELYWQDEARVILGLEYQDEAKAAEDMEAVGRLDAMLQRSYQAIRDHIGDQLPTRSGSDDATGPS